MWSFTRSILAMALLAFAATYTHGARAQAPTAPSSLPLPAATPQPVVAPAQGSAAQPLPAPAEIAELRTRANATERDLRALSDVEAARYNTIIVLLSLVGLLLAVVGVLLPILTYLTSIRPGNEVVRKAERILEELDARFEHLSDGYFERQVDRAIDQLGGPPDGRQRALMFLNYSQLGPLTESQLIRLTEHARTERRFQSVLLSIVARQSAPCVSRLMLELLARPDARRFLSYVIPNCVANKELRPVVRDWIAKHGLEEYRSALIMSLGEGGDFAEELANDERLLAFIPRGEPPERFCAQLKEIAEQHGELDMWNRSGLARLATGKAGAE
jgi:hypothetical protein